MASANGLFNSLCVATTPCNEVSIKTRSFIVKLWRDSDASSSPSPGWRGQVTSVTSGERLYANKPDEVPTLLAFQIGKSGIRLGWYWRIRALLYGTGQQRRRQK